MNKDCRAPPCPAPRPSPRSCQCVALKSHTQVHAGCRSPLNVHLHSTTITLKAPGSLNQPKVLPRFYSEWLGGPGDTRWSPLSCYSSQHCFKYHLPAQVSAPQSPFPGQSPRRACLGPRAHALPILIDRCLPLLGSSLHPCPCSLPQGVPWVSETKDTLEGLGGWGRA